MGSVAAEGSDPEKEFSVSHQSLVLEVDFVNRSLRGTTTITINPLTPDLRTIPLNFHQGRLERLSVNGKGYASSTEKWWEYSHAGLSTRQWNVLRGKIEPWTSTAAPSANSLPPPDLTITIPKTVDLTNLDPQNSRKAKPPRTIFKIKEDPSQTAPSTSPTTLQTPGAATDPATPSGDNKPAAEEVKLLPLVVKIDFVIENIRQGLHFVGVEENDQRYPHVYTTNSKFASGIASCLFPCVDSLWSRHTFELTIKSPRTLGDALRLAQVTDATGGPKAKNALKRKFSEYAGRMIEEGRRYLQDLSEADEGLEMTIVGAGDFVSESIDADNAHQKSAVFLSASPVSPLHIGFAIGPFETVNLAQYRDPEDEDKLGQNTVAVQAYCLPGRTELVQNTCLPIAKIIDYYTLSFGSYPCTDYRMCFVDDSVEDTAEMLSISICSNRLLFPRDIVDHLESVTRSLAFSLAQQWTGINIIPREMTDAWATIGMACFMTDLLMKKLCGNNDYRFWQKQQAARICEMDVDRPSLTNLGPLLHLDRREMDFMMLKAPVVLFILDRRMTKSTGSSGITRVISRIFLNAKAGDLPGGTLSTAYFIRTCEKFAHSKLDLFFNQWVIGAGCPRFSILQRFNKKKMVLEMTIKQEQVQTYKARTLEADSFMRDVKESDAKFSASHVQMAFLGPMTIRIHEADGTPYEHIVEIQGVSTKVEIPYNTKYKRLKRSRRQKERAAAAAGVDVSMDQEDVLLYCLGDVLQSEEEVSEWRLSDWSKDDEAKMDLESFEWIRMDADFEWICSMYFPMPSYMYVSQLQQDRDVVAQYESIQKILQITPHPIMSSVLLRTLMDKRYFHGIRVAAARGLAKCAREGDLNWIGLFHLEKAFQEMFCYQDSPMTRANDFSDRPSYFLQKIIPKVIASTRDNGNRAPWRAKKFVLEKLKFNDNSKNSVSDCYYIESLIEALSSTLLGPDHENEDLDGEEEEFLRNALNEVERYQRMDLWEFSHHNSYTIAALQCKARLIRAGKLRAQLDEFLPYTKSGTSDSLCVEAFRCIIELFKIQNTVVLPYFLTVMSSDRSPYVREQLWDIFGKGMAIVALGLAKPSVVSKGELMIDEDASGNERQAEENRKSSVEAALTALRQDLKTDKIPQKIPSSSTAGNAARSQISDFEVSTPASSAETGFTKGQSKRTRTAAQEKIENTHGAFLFEDEQSEPLHSSLWAAVTSPYITFKEQRALLDICKLLYEPVQARVSRLIFPREPEGIRYIGDGRIIIKFSNRTRTSPVSNRERYRLPPPTTASVDDGAASGKASTTAASQSLQPKSSSTQNPPTSAKSKSKTMSTANAKISSSGSNKARTATPSTKPTKSSSSSSQPPPGSTITKIKFAHGTLPRPNAAALAGKSMMNSGAGGASTSTTTPLTNSASTARRPLLKPPKPIGGGNATGDASSARSGGGLTTKISLKRGDGLGGVGGGVGGSDIYNPPVDDDDGYDGAGAGNDKEGQKSHQAAPKLKLKLKLGGGGGGGGG